MQPLGCVSPNSDSELRRVLRENELLEKKLSKAIGKRNYYAGLYYSCMLERDKAMAEREGAIKELHKVLTQLHQQGHNLTTASDSLSDVSRLISDSSSGSNPTPLHPSRSTSLASLLSSFQSHPSPGLHSPVEDSGLCTGGSTSSLADTDHLAGGHTSEGTLLSPDSAVSSKGKASDVRNLLEECAEALEGIADLRVGEPVKQVKHVPLNDNRTKVNYEHKYKRETAGVKLPNVSPVLANGTSLLARKARDTMDDSKRDVHKFVDTFEMQSGAWPRSDRDQRNCLPGNMESIPTALLEAYAQDASSLTWSQQAPSKLQTCDSPAARNYPHSRTFKLDRIEEMSCESSHSDNSLDQKVKENKVEMLRDKFDSEKSDSLLASANNKVSYCNLTTHELRQILFQLSTSRDSVSHLEFYRSSFDDEWVLLLLCDEIRVNKSLRTMCLIECALYTAADNLKQVMTSVKRSQLKYLSLARNGLTDGIVETLQVTEFFKISLPLAVLDLSENFISPAAVSLLISLSQNSNCEIKVQTQYKLTPDFNSNFEML